MNRCTSHISWYFTGSFYSTFKLKAVTRICGFRRRTLRAVITERLHHCICYHLAILPFISVTNSKLHIAPSCVHLGHVTHSTARSLRAKCESGIPLRAPRPAGSLLWMSAIGTQVKVGACTWSTGKSRASPSGSVSSRHSGTMPAGIILNSGGGNTLVEFKIPVRLNKAFVPSSAPFTSQMSRPFDQS